MEHFKLYAIQFIQFIVISILVSYVIIHDVIINKGYLQTDSSMIATAIAKTRTVGSINIANTPSIVDTMDIIYPELETNAVFITTSMIITPNQTRGICTPSRDGTPCNLNNDCPPLNTYTFNPSPGAVYTGICNTSFNICIVEAWCPIENESDGNIITNVGNGSIFLDIHVMFTSFDTIVSNTYDVNENGTPRDGYNLFVIDDIVRNATNNTANTTDISGKGIVILMVAEWNCDLDLDIKSCIPRFTYYRLDGEYDTITYGFNFRNVWYKNDYKMRMLMKRYGIRIIFMSFGTATKTNVNVLIVTVCLGIAALIISVILACYVFKVVQLVCVYEKKKPEMMDSSIYETDEISINSSPSIVLEGKSTTLMGHFQSTQM